MMTLGVLVDMHAWLSMALPEVPDRTPSEPTSYHFQSALLNTYLSAHFENGQATISSDNIMTVSVLKEMITKEATLRRVQVKVAKISIKDESVETVLDVLHPKLFYQLDLTRKIDLLDALNEVQMQERDITFMSPELVQILQEKEVRVGMV
jgi:Bardet-Biedl syndrome 7 protein